VDSLSHLLIIERAILDKSAAINDEGSNAMMSDYFRARENDLDDAGMVGSNPTFFHIPTKAKIVV
jgi:hypothetical protein